MAVNEDKISENVNRHTILEKINEVITKVCLKVSKILTF